MPVASYSTGDRKSGQLRSGALGMKRERRLLIILEAGKAPHWCFTDGFLFPRRVHDLLAADQEASFCCRTQRESAHS